MLRGCVWPERTRCIFKLPGHYVETCTSPGCSQQPAFCRTRFDPTRKRSALLRPRCPTLPARPPERESLTRPEARRVPRLGPRGRAAPLGCLAGEPLPAHRPALLRRTSARPRPDAPPENDPAASLPLSPPPSCRWTRVALDRSFFILRSESGALRLLRAERARGLGTTTRSSFGGGNFRRAPEFEVRPGPYTRYGHRTPGRPPPRPR